LFVFVLPYAAYVIQPGTNFKII